MSWDIDIVYPQYITCPHCKGQVEIDPEVRQVIGNYTYNVCEMYSRTLGTGLSALNGLKCGDLVEGFQRCVDDMRAKPAEYRALNPSNGWGDYEGALAYMEKILAGCKDHPDGILSVR